LEEFVKKEVCLGNVSTRFCFAGTAIGSVTLKPTGDLGQVTCQHCKVPLRLEMHVGWINMKSRRYT